MILANVPMGEGKTFLNIISLNVLGATYNSGIHLLDPTKLPEETDEAYDTRKNDFMAKEEEREKARFERIVDGLANGVATHKADLILLQEANAKRLQSLLENKFGKDWVFLSHPGSALISGYNTKRLRKQKSLFSTDRRFHTMYFEDQENKLEVDVHNLWGVFDEFPDKIEKQCEGILCFNLGEHVSVVMGDLNSRIAPLDDTHKYLATGIMPAQVNFIHGKELNDQIPDHPDGGFYRDAKRKIHQLEIKTLAFKEEMVAEGKMIKVGDIIEGKLSTEEEEQIHTNHNMMMCLDASYQTQKLTNNLTIFEYEAALKTIFNDDAILVRFGSNIFNHKSLAVRFSNNSALYSMLSEKLKDNKEIKFRHYNDYFNPHAKKFNCVFVPLNQADQLYQAIETYMPNKMVEDLEKLTTACIAEVGKLRAAYKILGRLRKILANDSLSSAKESINLLHV